MDNFDLYGFYQGINRGRIIFCYSGPISQPTIEGIGQTLRLDLEIEAAGLSTSQGVFSIFIEQMQNILNYSAEKITHDVQIDKELRLGILVIGREDDGFFVYCGNKVLNDDVARLQDRIDHILALDKGQLKVLYRERRKSQVSEEGSKGAGLGLIEMARKSGKPMDYLFVKIDEVFSFFSIKVVVSRRTQNG